MSVFLEGKVSQSPEPPPSGAIERAMTGKWHFVKEARSDLSFSYSRVSRSVPQDLLNYVSFIPDAHMRSLKLKQRGRKRGRPPLNKTTTSSAAPYAVSIVATVPTSDAVIPEESGGGGQCNGGGDNSTNSLRSHDGNEQTDSCDLQESASMDDDNYNDDIENDDNNGDNSDNEDNGDENENENESANEDVLGPTSTEAGPVDATIVKSENGIATPLPAAVGVTLTHPHPMVGLWEGTFAVKSLVGEENVKETFFLYSTLGTTCVDPLSMLPPYPHFSNFVRKQSIYSEKVRYIYTHCDVFKQESEAAAEAIVDEEGNLVSEAATGSATADDSKCTILFGFGRNPFGRFSLIVGLNEASSDIYCEKRYMLTKGATLKRGRKEGDAESSFERSITTRPHGVANYNFNYSFDDDPRNPRKKRLNAGKMRTFASTDSLYSDDGGLDLGKEKFMTAREADVADCDDYKIAFLDEENGEVYEGEWSQGCRHGAGICLYPDGTMFEGNWVFGKIHGHGQLLTGDRQVIYCGDWLDGLMQGHGTYNYLCGDKYVGDWREGTRHGRGEYIMQNGCRYVGDWKDNKRHGKGVFTWADDSVYDGEWENDSRHGRGVLELKSGFRYDGTWLNNYMDGRGVGTFKSGQEYQGVYKLGLREGRGSIHFSQGAVYEGRFRDDKIDGQGTIIINEVVPGAEEGDLYIPIEIQADIRRIHLKAGFGEDQ